MAGERLPLSRSSKSSSSTEVAGAHQMHVDASSAGDGDKEKVHDEAGLRGKGGKLRLSRSVLFRKKPYDRPAHPGSLDSPFSCSLNCRTSSFPSRLVDSASNLILSSASYLFESFFKRRQTRWIGNGVQSTVRMNAADMEHKEGSKLPLDNLGKDVVPSLQGPALEERCEKDEGEDSDLAKVEGILNQQFLSREEVKRLTDILQNGTSGGHVVGSNLEACRQQEKIQQVEAEFNPVKLAKAYMGECTSHFVRATPQWQRLPHRHGAVAGPSSIKRIKEVYERSPVQASKSGLASAERMLKRRLIADDEDNVISRGPTRRVRQKMTIMANTSPYIRQVTAASGLRTPSMPILQLTETTGKADKAVEETKLPTKGKSVEEPTVVASGNDVDPPESSKTRENLEAFPKKDSLALPTSSDLDLSNCKPVIEHVEAVAPIMSAPIMSKVAEKSATGSLAASPSELPTSTPERMKGFHMSAFFEDSSSDEEPGPPVKTMALTEQQHPGSSISLGTLQENTQKQRLICTPNDGSVSSAAEPTQKSSPILLQPNHASEPLNSIFNSLPAASSPATHPAESPSTLVSTVATERLSPFQLNLKPLPVVPSATEKEFLPFTPPGRAPSCVVLPIPPAPMSASPSVPTTLPATSVSFSVQGATEVAVVPSSSAAEVGSPSLVQKVAAAERVAENTSELSPAVPSLATITRVSETASFTAPAAALKSSVALVPTAASVSPVGSAASSLAMPANVPVVCQASTGGAQVHMTAGDSFLKAGSGVSFQSGSPGADRQAEGDTMATDPMTEEPDNSFTPSSTSLFLFGSASTVPMSLGQMPSFGSNATSTSPFLFPMPSSAPSGASSSASFPFSSQSSSSAGQLFTFGSSGTPPFLGNTQSSFSFGSSAVSSTSPVFTVTSSAPLTFPATPAAPSFQFGANAASSSTSPTSVFGAQMTATASAFATPGGQSNASAFVFSAPPTSSGATTPPAFQFGGAGATGPSFGGQSFTFGGQAAPMAGNPFAQNGALNAAPFQFGASAATPSQSVFPSGASTPSSLSFGAQLPSSSPFPFTFGAQPVSQPTGQPFSFGGQPAAPAQSPFSLSGATGQTSFPSSGASGMDFGGGFSLGAAGGEKAGRKFIKAKRIGGAKRGK